MTRKKISPSRSMRDLMRASPFLLPSVVGLAIFSLMPIILSLLISLTDWNGLDKLAVGGFFADHFIGLQNYKEILSGDEFWRVLGNTGYFIVLYLPLLFVCSLGIAWLLSKSYRGVGVFRVLYYIPVLTSWIAGALIFRWVLSSKFGIVNNILEIFGIQGPAWLQSEQWAMPSIVLASVWKDMGFYALILLSGLQGIDKNYYEAASIDGAGPWKRFWRITLPLLTPSLFFVLVVSLINAFQLFPQVMIMTDGGPNGATQVMVERIYKYGFRYYEMGYAAAFSWLLFIIIFAFTRLQLSAQKRWVHYGS